MFEDNLNAEHILSNIPCAILVLDSENKIVFANEHIQQLCGYSREELLGHDPEMIGIGTDNPGNRWWDWTKGTTIRRHASIRDRHAQKLDVLINAIRSGESKNDHLYLSIVELSRPDEWAIAAKKSDVSRDHFMGLIGKTPQMQELYDLIELASETTVNVIIQGESGTGKELVASAIHHSSSRSDKPFIRVNCAAIAETLLESELFGHVKGAFTGAYRDTIGKFEAAHEGTILLDEIGEVTPAMQVKLLRVLQERVITRVGDHHERAVDLRIIAATNKNLRSLVQKNLFREDLFYRLNVFPLHVPAVSERKTDIPLLCAHFLEKFRKQGEKNITSISTDVMRLFMLYCWPGNVRELENTIEHAFVVCKTDEISMQDLPYELRIKAVREGICAGKAAELPKGVMTFKPNNAAKNGRLSITAEQLKAELARHNGNKSATARALGISKVGLWKKMKKMEIE